MTPIEVIAFVLALGIIIKLLVLAINKRKWVSVVKKVYSKPVSAILVFFVLAIIVFAYIINELTIIQIFAVIAFSCILAGLAFAAYPVAVQEFAKRILKGKTPILSWIVAIVWLVLSVWVLIELLA